jgi:hypothetical protein
MLALTLHFSDCRINQHCLAHLTINQMPKKPEIADCPYQDFACPATAFIRQVNSQTSQVRARATYISIDETRAAGIQTAANVAHVYPDFRSPIVVDRAPWPVTFDSWAAFLLGGSLNRFVKSIYSEERSSCDYLSSASLRPRCSRH